MRVAAAQVHCNEGGVEANLEMTLDRARVARDQGADLVVFPELSLSGYCLGQMGDAYLDASLRLDDPRWDRLLRLSHEIAMAVGFVEETPDHRFYNSAVMLAEGEIQHVHRKLYLPTYGRFDEGKFFGAGKTLRAFDSPVGRIAMLICADAWHPSLPYLAAHDGADLLLVMAASCRNSINDQIDTHDAWRRLNQTHALTLGHFVVYVNHVGDEGGYHFSGGSHIVDASGRVLSMCSDEQPDIQLVDYDARTMRKQRIALPFRRDDSLELTLRIGNQLAGRRERGHPLGPAVGQTDRDDDEHPPSHRPIRRRVPSQAQELQLAY